jgi:hypothetical protein
VLEREWTREGGRWLYVGEVVEVLRGESCHCCCWIFPTRLSFFPSAVRPSSTSLYPTTLHFSIPFRLLSSLSVHAMK